MLLLSFKGTTDRHFFFMFIPPRKRGGRASTSSAGDGGVRTPAASLQRLIKTVPADSFVCRSEMKGQYWHLLSHARHHGFHQERGIRYREWLIYLYAERTFFTIAVKKYCDMYELLHGVPCHIRLTCYLPSSSDVWKDTVLDLSDTPYLFLANIRTSYTIPLDKPVSVWDKSTVLALRPVSTVIHSLPPSFLYSM